jgi:predicted Zn-dependent protease
VDGPIYAREFATLWPTDVHSCRFDTELALRGGDWTAARDRLETFFANDRFNTYVTLRLAEVLLRCGDPGRARRILDDFLKIKPLFLRARWLRWSAPGGSASGVAS